ncbi:hypothetical protein ACTWPB_06755 [Nocardia sp. IBHARD005]|uniref:hypothetical protein n=1 Tax=Nocardia sp. IBHARD005 TaxID=3457765 RepID=UPI004059EA8D
MAGDKQVDPTEPVTSESDVLACRSSAGAAGGDHEQAVVGSDRVVQAIDAVCGGITASFDVRYVGGAEGERIAAAQAKAVAALLSWLQDRGDIEPC